MSTPPEPLRVALVAGTLGQGGAEKQLVYMVQSLQQAGVDVRVYCLTQGEFHERALHAMGVPPIWIGYSANPLLRLLRLGAELQRFRPHIIQSAHGYVNLYVGLVGHLRGALSLGALRGSLARSHKAHGYLMRWLIRVSSGMVANSQVAVDEIRTSGFIAPKRVHVLPNVIDLAARDRDAAHFDSTAPHGPTVIAVGRLIAVKRLDRFLRALATARQQVPQLVGLVVGDGPERPAMEALAHELGLLPDSVRFLGQRDDVTALLEQADMFLMTSDSEGFPNVLLEAMAARLPVVTTPAGDAGLVVQDSVTGYVVPFDDIDTMAARLVQLAQSPDLRRELGTAGRRRVEQQYDCASLSRLLFDLYRRVAEQRGYRRVLRALPPPERRS